MCFSAKLLMEYFLLLVLMPAVLAKNESNTNSSIASNSMSCSCKNITTEKITFVMLPPAVGRIKVEWDKPNSCQGFIFFINFTQKKEHLCYTSHIIKSPLGNELCKERGCGEFLGFKDSGRHYSGYMIHKNLTVTSENLCPNTFLTCKDIYKQELVVYKVITGLLLTLIVIILLSRCAQPAYIAVRKRFSQKRQNRWIGPTQSQSVSYHRGQSNNPNNNTMKRQSFPGLITGPQGNCVASDDRKGLERLTVNPSREPSSNRNSDYDSYGA